MFFSAPARTVRRTRSTFLAATVVVSAPLVCVLVYQSLASSSFSAASPAVPHGDRVPGVSGIKSDRSTLGGSRRHDGQDRRRLPATSLGEEDGVVADGVTVFDHEVPAVAKLDPVLLGALRRAATHAAEDGAEMYVVSGWRSQEHQEQLLRQAVVEYGSEEEAARWVATPETSAHVSGDAVDIEPSEGTAWLSAHGAEYGLCQIYRNEPWHYELRPEASDHGCPSMYADPGHDPRMRQ